MTKEHIIRQLQELKVEFNPDAKKSELEALLRSTGMAAMEPETAEQPVQDGVEIPDGATITVTPTRVYGESVEVYDQNGVIRTYDRATHGDAYVRLAEEFAGKVSNRSVR